MNGGPVDRIGSFLRARTVVKEDKEDKEDASALQTYDDAIVKLASPPHSSNEMQFLASMLCDILSSRQGKEGKDC